MRLVRRTLKGAVLILTLLWAHPAESGAAEDMIAAALLAQYGTDLPQMGEPVVRLAQTVPSDVQSVGRVAYDPRTRQVYAELLGGGGRVVVRGVVSVELSVPVPVRRIAVGEILSGSDLASVRVEADRIAADAVTESAALIGREARRVLSPGRIVQASSVGAPLVVRRNQAVTLVYRSGGLTLSARGKALEDGGVGDLVRVVNVDSNRTLTGTVSGEQTVTVGP